MPQSGYDTISNVSCHDGYENLLICCVLQLQLFDMHVIKYVDRSADGCLRLLTLDKARNKRRFVRKCASSRDWRNQREQEKKGPRSSISINKFKLKNVSWRNGIWHERYAVIVRLAVILCGSVSLRQFIFFRLHHQAIKRNLSGSWANIQIKWCARVCACVRCARAVGSL